MAGGNRIGGGLMLRKALLIVGVTALLATAAATAAKPEPPGPLTGELLSAAAYLGHEVETDAECQADGSGVFTFSVEGVATGPYPGTFTESGTIVILSDGTIDSVAVTFEIDSPLATITGTKTVRPFGPFGAHCSDGPAGDFVYGVLRAFYTAHIRTAAGTFRDEGRTTGEFYGGDANEGGISEQFFSSLAEVVELKPGKGCGDKNHEHQREGDCRKAPR